MWFQLVSGPEMNENLMDVCESRLGKDLERLRIDYTAMDTLSNFTSLAEDVKAGGFKNVAILTSKSHVSGLHILHQIVFLGYEAIMYLILCNSAATGSTSGEYYIIQLWRGANRAGSYSAPW